jgi:RNA 2',3'-cyclic 3'-phosphodiesterase
MPDRGHSAHVRAFAAVCLPDNLLAQIVQQQEILAQKLGTGVRWTRREQIHLTLKFFGNVPDRDLEALKAALQRSVLGIQPMQLSIGQLGCFPSSQRPSVLWVGVQGELASLNKLRAQIEQETNAFGSHSEERSFHPHLTIGRVKAHGGEARQIGEVIRSARMERLGQWSVEQLTLFQSQLQSLGSIYTPLAAIPLARASGLA